MAYYPILGNALDISDFGGSEVFYNWMKGAPPDVSNHLFNLFLIDKTAKYFITDEKWTKKEMHGNICHIVGLSQETFLFVHPAAL